MFWNFTERQERDILADLTFASSSPPPSREGTHPRPRTMTRINSTSESTPLLSDSTNDEESQSPPTHYGVLTDEDKTDDKSSSRPSSLMVRVLKEMDVQIEDFHFEYNPRTRSPRIRDDMIT